jgi:hypothetical protein
VVALQSSPLQPFFCSRSSVSAVTVAAGISFHKNSDLQIYHPASDSRRHLKLMQKRIFVRHGNWPMSGRPAPDAFIQTSNQNSPKKMQPKTTTFLLPVDCM